MKILNPLYDNAFKYLMEDDETVKTILSIILGEKIISLETNPEEAFLKDYEYNFDYKAVVEEKETGENTAILVEVHMHNNFNSMRRFREYIDYKIANTNRFTGFNQKYEDILPLFTICIVGFDIPEINSRAVRFGNTIYNSVTKEKLNVKSSFINSITQTRYILTAKEKKNDDVSNTVIEQFVDLFMYKLKEGEVNPIIEIDEKSFDNKLLPIMERLRKATLDEELMEKVKTEQRDYIDN